MNKELLINFITIFKYEFQVLIVVLFMLCGGPVVLFIKEELSSKFSKNKS